MNAMLWASFKTTLTTTLNSSSASVSSGTNIAAGQTVNSINVPAGTTWATFSGTSGTLAFPTQTYYGQIAVGTAQIVMQAGSGGVGTLPASLGILTGAAVSDPNGYFPAGVTVIGPGAVPGTLQLSAGPTTAPPSGQAIPIEFALTNSSVTGTSDPNATFTGTGVTFSATILLERSVDGGKSWPTCNVGGSGTQASYSAGTPVSLTFGEPELGVMYRWNCTVYGSNTGITINYRISTTGEAATALAVGTMI